MAVKRTYIDVELSWAEDQLRTWKEYIDNNPIHDVVDRMSFKETKNGGLIQTCIQTKEATIKSITELMQKYLLLLSEVDKLREKEEAKIESRGKGEISSLAEDFLKNR